MLAALKAEFRKLLSVRSTYILSLGFLLLSAFVDFYVHGYKDSQSMSHILNGSSPLDYAQASLFVAGSITQIASIASVAAAFIALLLLAHEYRYNTIIYTLSYANRRSKVLLAKIVAVLTYVFVYSVVATAISLALIWAGAAAAGHALPHQDINRLVFFAKCVFYSEAFALSGLLFIALIRNQVGAIAALLVLPNTIEGLLSLLLKQHSVYMPFMALSQVIVPPVVRIGHAAAHPDAGNLGSLSPVKGAGVFLIYLVIGWIVAWWLFVRRDAN